MARSCFLHIGSIAAFAAALVPVACQASDVDLPQWSTYDLNLTSSSNYTNGYASGPTLSATFTGPNGVTKTVDGFWDGGSKFTFRFTPTVEGSWSYTTSSSDSSLNGQAGTINATAPAAGQHGFVRVDAANQNSFVYDDGTRYFMMGQTYYDWIGSAMQNDNWKTSVLNSKAAGFTKIRFDVYMGGLNNGAQDITLYPDVQPYAGTSTSPNRDQLNLTTKSFDGLTYFQKLDEMVQFMDANGMAADMIVTNPYYHQRMFGTDTQNDRFVNYVVDRYAAYANVTWCLCNEWEKMTYQSYSPCYAGELQTQADFSRLGAIIHNNDPWGEDSRTLSIHNMQQHFQFFGESWPTHAAIQYGDSNHDDRAANAGIVANLGHSMPVVNDEFGYIGTMTRLQQRQSLWGIAAAGGYGSTADFRTQTMGVPENTGDWYDQSEYADVKALVDFFTTEGIEYWKMAANNTLKSSSRSRDYVLAEPGRQYVLYTATGGSSVQLNLSGYGGVTFNAWKYDPSDGTMTSLGPTAGGAWRSFNLSAANAVGEHDWVLLVTALPVPEPGTSALLGIGVVAIMLYTRRRR